MHQRYFKYSIKYNTNYSPWFSHKTFFSKLTTKENSIGETKIGISLTDRVIIKRS